jgi:hypothetical protein
MTPRQRLFAALAGEPTDRVLRNYRVFMDAAWEYGASR